MQNTLTGARILIEEKLGRILELDALRGIAILLVLLTHSVVFTPWANLFTPPTFGSPEFNPGVVLFFVVSGFTVTMTMLSSTYNGLSFQQKLKKFFTRRFWRIQPLAFVWIALTLFGAWLGTYVFPWRGYFGEFHQTIWNSLFVVLPIANFKSEPAFGGNGPFAVFWSLAIEEQFYLFFPFIIFTTPDRRRMIAWTFLLLIVCMLLVDAPIPDAIFAAHIKIQQAFRAPWFQPILIGVLSYFAFDILYRCLSKKFDVHIRILGVLSLIIALFLNIEPHINSIVVPFFYGFSVIASAFSARGPQLPFTGSFAWFGRRSYGIYLAHLPASMLNRELWNSFLGGYENLTSQKLQSLSYLTWALMTFAAVEIFYRWIEKPLIDFGRMNTKAQMSGQASASI